MTNYAIALMTIEHYDEVYLLWRNTDGVGLSNADSKENIVKFLKRNVGLSFIAIIDTTIVGSILGSHDGRRGYIHHLTVHENHRHNGIGKVLVENCLKRFKEIGLHKTHVFVFKNNENAIKFWEKINYSVRNDLVMMSLDIE
jgi:N-acetylglutamate synthase